MKFSDLNSNMRSMLTALCASSTLNTEQLGNGCVPKLTAQQAANTLNEMRAAGLVYSMQKPESRQYASWAVNSVGKAMFTGRPDGNVVLQTVPASDSQCSPAKDTAPERRFILGEKGGTLVVVHGTREKVLEEAQRRATVNAGTEYNVYEQIAVAHMPVPQAQITLL